MRYPKPAVSPQQSKLDEGQPRTFILIGGPIEAERSGMFLAVGFHRAKELDARMELGGRPPL